MNKVEMDLEIEDLISFLRRELNNYSIEIEIEVKKTKREKLVYSASEKFKYLKKVNPLIEDLRDEFNLDFL